MNLLRHFLYIMVVFLASGCSLVAHQQDGLSKTRSTDPRSEIRTIEVSRGELSKRAANPEALNNIRLVRVYLKSAADGEVPEYKIFNLQTGGPYSLLGLQNGDVLVSAQNFVVRQPFQFVEYVKLMSGEASPSIQIRRGIVPLELRYSFVE